MPPGSPGIFRRRKSSTYEGSYNHSSLIAARDAFNLRMSDSPNETPQEIPPSPINTGINPWPISKDDYELKEIIGK